MRDFFISDERPPLLHLGWAPSGYSNICRHCGGVFTGDKYAGCCADCAYAIEGEAPKRVYIAGKMSGMPNYNFDAFDRTVLHHRDDGLESLVAKILEKQGL